MAPFTWQWKGRIPKRSRAELKGSEEEARGTLALSRGDLGQRGWRDQAGSTCFPVK